MYFKRNNRVSDINISIIPLAGTELYSRGISLFRFNNEKRQKYYNPILVFIVILIIIIRCFIALFTPKAEKQIFIYLGDYTYFMNQRIHSYLNIGLISASIVSLLTRLIYFRLYYKKINPTFLKPFYMISGLVSPKKYWFRKCIRN